MLQTLLQLGAPEPLYGACRLASSPLAHTPLSVLTPQAGEGDSFESVKSALVSLLSSLSLLTLFELLCLAGMILDSR